MSPDAAGVTADIENSLDKMKTDYIDVFQFHNLKVMHNPEDPNDPTTPRWRPGKKATYGTSARPATRCGVAMDLIETGLYETMMFPFSYLSGEKEHALVKRCSELDVGFIAMKGLSGGLLTNSRACYAWMPGRKAPSPSGASRAWNRSTTGSRWRRRTPSWTTSSAP
jgi:aryl-alcohol dehydrogenase-like predicted oxidoreductase